MTEFQKRITDDFLNQKRLIADPLADQLLQDMVDTEDLASQPPSSVRDKFAKSFFDTLIRNIDLPVETFPERVKEFIRTHEQFPTSANQQQLKLAYQYFVDHGPKMLAFLYYKSLPLLYACKNGAEVLVQTGRLAHQQDKHLQFTRRIAETGQFLINVMLADQLWKDQKAIHSILKVRLIHASIRQFIPREHWDINQLGEPINQEDMAITLMTFSISLIDALDQFGVESTVEEQEAYLQSWMAIGQLLGVDKDLLPPTLEDARFLIRKILDRQAGASEAGRELTAALIQFANDTLRSEKLKLAPSTLIRFLTGPQIANYLGVSNQIGCLSIVLPEALRSLFNLEEKLEKKSPHLNLLINQIAKQLSIGMVGYFNSYKNVHFQIPQQYKHMWNLE